MWVCICNQIDEKMLEENPALKDVCGSQCGSCIREEDLPENDLLCSPSRDDLDLP